MIGSIFLSVWVSLATSVAGAPDSGRVAPADTLAPAPADTLAPALADSSRAADTDSLARSGILDSLRSAGSDSLRSGAHDTPVRAVVVLPEVHVEGERLLVEARRRLPTAFVTELHAGRSNRAIESLSDLLGEAAGVRVVEYGGLGAFSTVSLRGAPGAQVSVYLDGAPLTSAAHGVVNLADLPVTAVERVEVYRGMAPLDWGLATPGGAINLVTRSAAAPARVRVARGSFDTWEGRGTWSARLGRVTGLAHAGYQGSRGDFAYFDDNGTPFNAADDDTSLRRNNRFDAGTLLGSLVGDLGDLGRVALREDFVHKRQGLPGMGATPAMHPRLSVERSIASLDWERAAFGAWPSAAARASWERGRSRFRDATAELGLGSHDTDDRSRGDHYTLVLGTPRLPLGLAAQGSGSWRSERAMPTDARDAFPDPPASTRRDWGASFTAQARPLGDRVVLYAGRRWDRMRDALRSVATGGIARRSDVVRELDAPQLGLRVTTWRGLELRGNWSRATRAPDFLELFGNQGSVLGNPTLAPERAENWDAGGAWSLDLGGIRASVEGAHYATRADDLIVYVRGSPSSVRAMNISRCRIRGEELTARIATPFGVTASCAGASQSTLDQGDVVSARGRRLPQRPEHLVSARLDVVRGPVRLAADVERIGENFLDRANRLRVPSRTLLGASLSYEAHGARLTVEVKNLGDARASDVGGFPLPGRAVFASLDLRLGPAGAEQP